MVSFRRTIVISTVRVLAPYCVYVLLGPHTIYTLFNFLISNRHERARITGTAQLGPDAVHGVLGGFKKCQICTTRLRLPYFPLTCCRSVFYDLSPAASW